MRNGEVKVGARDRLKITHCCCLVTKLCPTLLHWRQPTRLLWWARILEWVVISLSRGSSWPRDQTQVSCIAGGFFLPLSPREDHHLHLVLFLLLQSHSVMSPHGLQPARLLCPWNFPASILEWVAISFSRGSFWSRDWTYVSCIAGRFFTTEPPGKPKGNLNSDLHSIRYQVWRQTEQLQVLSRNEWGSEVKVTQLCLTLCDLVDYTVHGILQARVLEWVAYPRASGSSWPRNWTRVSNIVGRLFTNCAIREDWMRKGLLINRNGGWEKIQREEVSLML